jgi:hypothetical protein
VVTATAGPDAAAAGADEATAAGGGAEGVRSHAASAPDSQSVATARNNPRTRNSEDMPPPHGPRQAAILAISLRAFGFRIIAEHPYFGCMR